MSDELHNRISAQTSRGKVAASAVSTRTMLTVTGLDGETFQNVELLLPPGYVARPPVGADVIVQQINGHRDHKAALFGDHPDDAVALADGEIGFSRNGQTIILRQDSIEIVSARAVTITAPAVASSGNLGTGIGATGTFSTPTGQTVTVRDGIVTNIF